MTLIPVGHATCSGHPFRLGLAQSKAAVFGAGIALPKRTRCLFGGLSVSLGTRVTALSGTALA